MPEGGPGLTYERAAHDAGHVRVCGVDEAGRGPLAGPVVAACVVLDQGVLGDPVWRALDDSKRMRAADRDTLYEAIMESADVGVGICDVDRIDLLNILGATLQAMADAVRAVRPPPAYALIDGNRLPVLTCDRIMPELAQRYPGYGWERNAGYGTAEHMAALQRLGATPHHRRSFAPVREALARET
jgi:ribonuclease HII